MVLSQSRGTPNRPQYTTVLTMGALKKGALILGNSHIGDLILRSATNPSREMQGSQWNGSARTWPFADRFGFRGLGFRGLGV